MEYKYKITGVDKMEKRFKIESNNFAYISCISCYKGSLWERKDGKYKRIKIFF